MEATAAATAAEAAAEAAARVDKNQSIAGAENAKDSGGAQKSSARVTLVQGKTVGAVSSRHHGLLTGSVKTKVTASGACLSQLVPEPDNGGCMVHREILRVEKHQGSRDCCTRVRVGGDDAGNVMILS